MAQQDLPIANRLRKLGDPHPETIQIHLTDEQRAERRKAACDLRDQHFAVTEEAKLKSAEFKQRLKAIANQESAARQQASTGIEVAAVVVQDFLTAGNEVVSLRVDTNEVVARRTATSDELQEDLFGADDDNGFSRPQ